MGFTPVIEHSGVSMLKGNWGKEKINRKIFFELMLNEEKGNHTTAPDKWKRTRMLTTTPQLLLPQESAIPRVG